MRHLIAIATSFVLVLVPVLTSAVPSAAGDCQNPGWTSTCHASTDGSQVNVGGTRASPGSGGSNSAPDREAAPPRGGDAPAPDEAADAVPAGPEDCGLCRGGYSVGVIRAVTAADLASFVPARPSFSSEPGGVGIVGMPSNFVAGATEQTLTGTLFDLPVTVRFAPAAYVFAYGDGASARSASGGAAWSSLGQTQFSATPTGHAYGTRGTFVASVSVEYAATVNFGSGWRPVEGTVTATTGGQQVRVYEARTALVDKTCLERPTGPGC